MGGEFRAKARAHVAMISAAVAVVFPDASFAHGQRPHCGDLFGQLPGLPSRRDVLRAVATDLRSQWREPLELFPDEGAEDVTRRIPVDAPEPVTLWNQARRSPRAKPSPHDPDVLVFGRPEGAVRLEMDRRTFARSAVAGQSSEPGTILNRLGGGKLAELTSALFDAVVLGPQASSGKVDFADLAKGLAPGYRVESATDPSLGPVKVVRNDRGETLYAVAEIVGHDGVLLAHQLVLPLPEPLLVLRRDRTTVETQALIVTVTKTDRANLRVVDVKPLLIDSRAARDATRMALDRARIETRIAQLEKSTDRRVTETALKEIDEQIRETANAALPADGLGAMAANALTGVAVALGSGHLLGSAELGSLSLLGGIAGAAGGLIVGGVSDGRWDLSPRTLLWKPWSAVRIAMLRRTKAGLERKLAAMEVGRRELERLRAELEAFPVVRRLNLSTPRAYRPKQELLRAFWDDHRDGLVQAERDQLAVLFQRAEDLALGEAQIRNLLRIMDAATRTAAARRTNPFELSVRAGSAHVKMLEDKIHPIVAGDSVDRFSRKN